MSKFWKIFIVYIVALLICILAVDIFLWSKLATFEKNENAKEQQKADIDKQVAEQIITATPTPLPTAGPTATPTPEPVYQSVTINVPEGVTVTVGGEAIDLSTYTAGDGNGSTFDILYEFSGKYSEYSDIANRVTIPSRSSYSFSILEGLDIVVTDATGNTLTATETVKEDGSKILDYPYNNDMTDYDTISAWALEAMKQYAWFCTNDVPASNLNQYFPSGSEYLASIASLDNSWYVKHDGTPDVTNVVISDYCRYSENLVYMDISFTHTINVIWSGETKYVDINNPVWMINEGSGWKVLAIVY